MPTYEIELTLVVQAKDRKDAEKIADRICNGKLPAWIDAKIERFSYGDPEEIPEEE